MMVVKEPPKSAVLAYAPGTPLARHSFSVILDRRGNRTFEAVVDVNAGTIVSWNQIKGVQPLVLAGEYEVLSKLVKADPRWQAAMKKRDITDFAQGADRRLGRGPVAGGVQGQPDAASALLLQGRRHQLLRPADRRGRRAGQHEHRQGRGGGGHRRCAAAAAEPGARRKVHGHAHRAQAAGDHPA